MHGHKVQPTGEQALLLEDEIKVAATAVLQHGAKRTGADLKDIYHITATALNRERLD